MNTVRYRLVSWADVSLPIVDGGDGLVWFWGESFPLPKGKTLETVETADLGLRPDPGAPPIEIGPVEAATGDTELEAWRHAQQAGHWPATPHKGDEAAPIAPKEPAAAAA